MKTTTLTIPETKNPPLLKWPGGKRNLVAFILRLVPPSFNRYFEPFLGGGALFFALQPKKAYLSDKNADLMQAYVQVRDRPDEVVKALRKLRNSETDYYRIRSALPTDDATLPSDGEAAADPDT